MPFDVWITLATVTVVFVLMATTRIGPDIILLGGVVRL